MTMIITIKIIITVIYLSIYIPGSYPPQRWVVKKRHTHTHTRTHTYIYTPPLSPMNPIEEKYIYLNHCALG